MAYRKATYEEYCKASAFAKIRYRFGCYIELLALLCFIGALIYTIINIEEMKANPIDYAEEKLGVMCYNPLSTILITEIDYTNGTGRNFTGIEEG
tara:strand:- start:169 stop:453 length:285 start_codon:yes stop_codon:yes gene_type:complete